MSEIEERRAAVSMLLLQKGVLDALQDDNKRFRPVVADMLEVGDTVAGRTPDGTPLGKVRMNKPAKTARVTDRGAVVQWCQENRPDLLVMPEDTGPVERALNAALAGEDTVEDRAVLMTAAHRWLGHVKAEGSGPTLLSTSEKALLDGMKDLGGMVDKATGEIVAVPGITVGEAAPTITVTVDADTMPGVVSHLLRTSGLRAIES